MAKRKIITVKNFPEYDSGLVNEVSLPMSDSCSGLNEHDALAQKQRNRFYAQKRRAGYTLVSIEGEPGFCWNPAYGLPCNVVTATFMR